MLLRHATLYTRIRYAGAASPPCFMTFDTDDTERQRRQRDARFLMLSRCCSLRCR